MMNPAEFANIARTEEGFWWFKGMQRILFRVLEQTWAKERPQKVLEVGGGTGHQAEQLSKHFKLDVHMADLAAEGLHYARSRGLRDLAQADIQSLPFQDAGYDAVVSLDVLVHLPEGREWGAFRELVRVVRPGGWVVIRVSALKILRSRHSEFTQERQRFTRGRLMRLADECGLTVERCTYLNSLLLPVALTKFRIWEPLVGAPAQSGLEPVAPWLNSALEAVLRMECAWIGSGRDFPAGQSLLLVARKVR